MYRKHALFYVVIGFTILCCFSCRQIDSGKVEITNSLSSIVRITFAQNYGREIISMNPGQTIKRDYEYYHEVLFPDELPRATYRFSGSRYTIIPLDQNTKTIYVTNKMNASTILYNSHEIDTEDYVVPVSAVNIPISFTYFRFYVFALRNFIEEEYTIETKTEDITIGETSEKRLYLLIRPKGFS